MAMVIAMPLPVGSFHCHVGLHVMAHTGPKATVLALSLHCVSLSDKGHDLCAAQGTAAAAAGLRVRMLHICACEGQAYQATVAFTWHFIDSG